MSKKLYSSIEKNKAEIAGYFENSADYFCKDIKTFSHNCAVIVCEALVDLKKLWDIYLMPLNDLQGEKNGRQVYDYMKNKTAIPFNPTECEDFEKAMFFLTSGFGLIFIDGVDKAMVMPIQGYPSRAVDKPTNEGNLRGSKESFTDAGRKNMALIRRRIRSKNLVIKTMQSGDKTKTEISIYYHADYCPPRLAQAVEQRVKNINLPMVFESGYITPFVDKTKYSLFSAVGYTERPDTFCAKLCEGKVGIVVDGTPYGAVYPYFFAENFSANDDYTQRPYFASFIRILRYLAFIISIALPGFYVAFTSFAPQSLADKLLFFIYSSQASTPLPLFLEAVVITILFEIIKEAGLRLPQPIGNSVSIVSALIIGDAAVNAGLIGGAILIVCALSTVTSFIIPSFYEPIIILRMVFVIFAGIFGIPGLSLATLILFVNIINVNSEGYGYISYHNSFFKDGFLKTSWRKDTGKDFDLRSVGNGR